MFTTPCFIRKNTPELRKKLEELGYGNRHLSMVTNVEEYPLLQAYRDGFYDGIIGDECGLEFYIDCGTNEELFLALAALRDDTDINRWFKDLETNELFICNKHSIYDMATPEDLEEYGDWIGIGMCKYQIASVEEIIEHFKDK